MCGHPQALIWAKKIGFRAFLGFQSSLILKITIFANLKIAILGYLVAFSLGKKCLFNNLVVRPLLLEIVGGGNICPPSVDLVILEGR